MHKTKQTHLSVREAADEADRVPMTIIRWIREGKIDASKAFQGARAPYLIDRESFETYLLARAS